MHWLKQKCIGLFRFLCIKLLKAWVRVPQHVAIIMDGNRRFARKKNVQTIKGHNQGYVKLLETIKWCSLFGIPEVTVYAFSIENFKRSKKEVDALMDLARRKAQQLLDEIDVLKYLGIRVHFTGRLSLLPDYLKNLLSRLMISTKYHDKYRLNIAVAYTGRDEISRTASLLVDAVHRKEISPDDIDETLVSKTMELSEPELLIRTSGEVRLSDFMLWQVSTTVLYFTDVLWPEFSVWSLLAAIRHYSQCGPRSKVTEALSERKRKFLENLETRRWKEIEKNVGCS